MLTSHLDVLFTVKKKKKKLYKVELKGFDFSLKSISLHLSYIFFGLVFIHYFVIYSPLLSFT